MSDEKPGRNDSCPCGSGKKYKKCCLLEVLQKSDVVDPSWRKLRQVQGDLQQDLLQYVVKSFPRDLFQTAWDSFFLHQQWRQEQYAGAQDTIFSIWLLFDWVVFHESQQQPIALHYLNQFYHRVTDKQRQFIELICKTHYSFYVVLDVVARQSMRLKDILTDTEYTVREYQATESVCRGDILFSRILTVDGVSICVGTAPRIIPSGCHLVLLAYRNELQEKNTNPLTVSILRSISDDVRRFYFDLMEEQFNQPMPVLHNEASSNLNELYVNLGLTK